MVSVPHKVEGFSAFVVTFMVRVDLRTNLGQDASGPPGMSLGPHRLLLLPVNRIQGTRKGTLTVR